MPHAEHSTRTHDNTMLESGERKIGIALFFTHSSVAFCNWLLQPFFFLFFSQILEQIVSTGYRLLSFDFYKMTKAYYATFNMAFRLVMTRESDVMGLATYFQIEFTKSHLPISVSTAPGAGVTSWNQRVFLWPRRLTNTLKGDVILGLFHAERKCEPSLDQKFSICVQYENEERSWKYRELMKFRLIKNANK